MRLELTKRGDYAIRAVLALAAAGAETLSVRRIAAAQSIPTGVLARLMSDLVSAGLVQATAGRSGGYRLARVANRISLLDIIQAVEGDVRRRSCILRGGPCRSDAVCAVHPVFAAAQSDLVRTLGETTVSELVAGT